MRKFIFILLCLICSVATADTKPRVFIFHINGVNTTEKQAVDNYRQLLEVAKIESNIVTWNYLYNPTHGNLASDLWDVFLQKAQENQELTIYNYVDAYIKAHNLPISFGSKEYNDLKDHIKEDYAKEIGYVGYNFDTILHQYREKTQNKFAASIVNLLNSQQDRNQTIVLLIPHSQGVLYANALRDFLIQGDDFPQENIGIFGIAAPVDHIETGIRPAPEYYSDPSEPYVTADNDYVINELEKFSAFSPITNAPLRGNIHLKTCNDHLCHNLIDAYLADPIGASIISKKINLYLSQIETNIIQDQQNPVTFRMTDNGIFKLIGPGNQTLCSDGHCDDEIFGRIKHNPGFDQSNRMASYFTFSYPGKLKAGDYLVVQELNTQPLALTIISGGILDAYRVFVTGSNCSNNRPPSHPDCSLYTDSLKNPIAGFSVLNLGSQFGVINSPPYCSIIPNACFNNSPIIAKFVLGAPG